MEPQAVQARLSQTPSECRPVRPLPSEDNLRCFYVGKDIADVPKPAAIVDINIVRRHCNDMLRTTELLGVGFRAHVKSHKTSQIARLQVGTGKIEANYVASTIAEMEHLVPVLQDLISSGRPVNILYGMPLMPSCLERLAALSEQLGASSISVLIDHHAQIQHVQKFSDLTGSYLNIFLKVDTGYHRAGLSPTMLNKGHLLEKIMELEKAGHVKFLGFYSHSSLSYNGSSPEEAMTHLTSEILACKQAIELNANLLPPDRKFTISVGASPQVLSSKTILHNDGLSEEGKVLQALLKNPLGTRSMISAEVELHAGVYCLLDMQQIATNACPMYSNPEAQIALSVVAEVCSVYNDCERSTPEALIAAGTLALGREPCHNYRGWGLVTSRQTQPAAGRLIVDRISQEHSIVAWDSTSENQSIPLQIGQTVRILPNHACVTGAMYGWYLVVDSSLDLEASRIVDVWVRTVGW